LDGHPDGHAVELALELGLPVVIHAREAEKDAYELVQRAGVRAYFHSYAGSIELAREIVENGHVIGINTGVVFIPEVRAVAEAIDVDYLLVETDSPYMSPFKGQRNRPCNVKVAVEWIAKLQGIEFEAVEVVTEKNAVEFFDLGV